MFVCIDSVHIWCSQISFDIQALHPYRINDYVYMCLFTHTAICCCMSNRCARVLLISIDYGLVCGIFPLWSHCCTHNRQKKKKNLEINHIWVSSASQRIFALYYIDFEWYHWQSIQLEHPSPLFYLCYFRSFQFFSIFEYI